MRLTHGAQRLLNLFRWFRSNRMPIFASRAWLAHKLKCSVKSITRWIQALLSAGLVRVEHRHRKPSLIALLDAVRGGSETAASQRNVPQNVPPIKNPSLRVWSTVRSLPSVVFITPVKRAAKKIREKRSAFLDWINDGRPLSAGGFLDR